THVIDGTPRHVVQARNGEVLLFAPHRIIAYLVRVNRRARAFVFRSLSSPERLSAKVPGVFPPVRLLIEAHTGRQIRRLRLLFSIIRKRSEQPDRLTDRFYLCASITLTNRVASRRRLALA